MKSTGIVYLVGAGPGDAGLLTMRGAALLARADVVVYDALVNPELLRLAPKPAEMIYAGKRAKEQVMSQDELNQLLVAKADQGKIVIRLKGGDPYIFGRGGEEAEALANAHIPFEVIPGVSSVVAAPSYAGIPLTHRMLCSSFTVITGHEDPEKDENAVDWKRMAQVPGTKVILMGAERIRQIMEALIGHGMAADTPVAMIRWGTTGRQESIAGTASTIADLATARNLTAPAVTVIGDVVNLRTKLNWFEKRPLFGQQVVVTRAREQASQLTRDLAERGAEVLELPTIKTTTPDNKANLKDAILALHEYDWVVFTSVNGVNSFFGFFFQAFDDLRDVGGVKIAAVGPATAAKLKELHLRVNVMPEEYAAAKIVAAMQAFESIENLRVLLLRAEVANTDLPKLLEEEGAIVDDVACYKTVPETEDASGASEKFLESGADWITFTSASTVQNFHSRFDLPAMVRKFPAMQLASIGPETSKALAALGLKPSIEAKHHTIPGLVKALEDQVRRAAKTTGQA